MYFKYLSAAFGSAMITSVYSASTTGRRERRLTQGPHGDGHELHGIVVRRNTVGAERAAALAAVYDRPFTAPAYPDRHRLHDAAAVGSPVAGLDVYVQAGKAVGAVVAMLGAGRVGGHQPPAHLAGKAVVAGVIFVVALFKGLAFILSVHLASCGCYSLSPSGGLFSCGSSRSLCLIACGV